VRTEAQSLIAWALPGTDPRDTDYVFLTFVLRHVPAGLVGLLVAVILCAAMGSSASELAALGSTTTIDLYKRLWRRPASDRHDLLASKFCTVLWGAVAVGFATFATLIENLIQAVNIVGSIFYGTLLGLFVVAFFLQRVTATPVLIAAVVAQTTVVVLFFTSEMGFLWYNVVGCSIVVLLSFALQLARQCASPT
jgi:Na+/proline symporter